MKNIFIIQNKPSIVYVNSTDIDSERIDSAFYSNQYVSNEITLKECGIKVDRLENIIETMNAPIGWQGIPSSSYLPHGEGVPLIRVQNVSDLILDEESLIGVEENIYEEQPAIQAEANNIIITRVGSVGRVCRIPENISRIAMGQNLTRIKLKETLVNSGFMLAYMASKYCQFQIERYSYGGVQASLTNKNIKKLMITVPKLEIQEYIGDKIKQAEHLKKNSKLLNREIEKLFEDSISIDINDIIKKDSKWSFVKENDINEDNIAACYYKQQYLEIEKKLSETSINLIELEKVTNSIKLGNTKKVSNYYCNKGVPYITTKNITKKGIDLSKLIFVPSDISNEYLSKSKAYPNDILYNKSGNVGLSSILGDEYNEYNVVSDIIIIRPSTDKIDPYYLNVFLNSKLGKLGSERMSGGAIFQHISIYDVGKIKIPMLPYKLQREIGNKKIEAELCEIKANNLIEEAKRDVEDLIEGKFDISKVDKFIKGSR